MRVPGAPLDNNICELNKVNPFDYMVAIAEKLEAAAVSPMNWLSWNYEQNLEK
ncbi:MAG: hypothetical protein JXR76_28810 [Deltaproteobacteria bacterium]|nr:hypothetical protein [Deltaproteobacteria bacterium]